MTIDEAIAKYKEIANTGENCPAHCKISCDKCVEESEQLAEWLEELKSLKENSISKETFEKMKSKAYKKGHRQGYNKAIDDIVIKIKESVGMDWEWDFMFIEQIAEQLKEGKA